MPFTPAIFPLLTPEQMNPAQAALSNALSMYQKGVQSRYAPRMAEAEIFNKQFGPLAQIAISPLAQAFLPEQKTMMNELIGNLLKQNSGMMGGGGGAGSGGLSGLVRNIFGGGQQSTPSQFNIMSNQGASQYGGGSENYDPSLPQKGQGQGTIGAGAGGRATAPYTERIHTPNAVYIDQRTGKTYVDPGSNRIQAATNSIQALQRVFPQLKKIAEGSSEFTTPSGMFKENISELGGWLSTHAPLNMITPEKLKSVGIDPDKPSRYQQWQNHINLAAKDLMQAYPDLAQSDQTLNYIRGILQPLPGETTGYAGRVISALNEFNQRQQLMQQQMMPVEVTGTPVNFLQNYNEPSETTNHNKVANNTASNKLANEIKLPKFKNAQEFQNWYNKQTIVVQKAVRKQLEGKQ